MTSVQHMPTQLLLIAAAYCTEYSLIRTVVVLHSRGILCRTTGTDLCNATHVETGWGQEAGHGVNGCVLVVEAEVRLLLHQVQVAAVESTDSTNVLPVPLVQVCLHNRITSVPQHNCISSYLEQTCGGVYSSGEQLAGFMYGTSALLPAPKQHYKLHTTICTNIRRQ